MNDFLPRSEISPIDRIVVRPVVAVTPVQPASQSGADLDLTSRRPVPAQIVSGDGADMASASEEQLASAAEYARIHARIADILATINSDIGTQSQVVTSADGALQSLLPVPIIIVPLPPASKDMVEHAARVAKQLVEQASIARSAQANVKPGTVDQILATVA